MPSRLFPLLAAGAALAFAAPAFAQDAPQPSPPPPPVSDAATAPSGTHQGHPGYDTAAYERARAEWLNECRRRHGSGNTVGGAVAGGLVGGLIGNRIAGRGDRTEGTVIGAAAGAAAGGVIGNAADNREARERADYCQSYLDHYASYGQGGHGYAMQPMMVMVPVAMVPATAPAKAGECVEEIVTEEYEVPPARRIIPPPPRRVPPPKRVPDKRVRVY